MRKKNVYEVEMCDDQLRFFLFLVLLSRRPKSWIFSSSPIFDKSQISLFSWSLVLVLHRLHGWREERCACSSSNVVAKKNVWSGRRISRRAIHNYFPFFLINGSSKESKPSEAHPRIFFLSLLLLPMTRVNPIELFFYGQFRLLFIEQKSLRQSRLPDGTICMKRCRRVGNSGEKVWLW